MWDTNAGVTSGTLLVCQEVVLFGGRPLPARPLWVRLLIVLFVLRTAAPIVKFVFAHTPDLIFGPPKMTAAQTAAAVPARLSWAPKGDPKRDVRCEEHRQTSDWSPARNGAWDYICTFVPRPEVSPSRLKVGVLVGRESITWMSQEYALDAEYVR